MNVSRKTVVNILIIAVVVSFFVTPLGYHGKVLLNRIFSFSPNVLDRTETVQIPNYDWELKDANWNFFNFDRSRGQVVFINFWASWRLPCTAELKGVQSLYDRYGEKADFYIITNEERAPVEEFMAENGFTFPVTYLIIGEPAPFEIPEPPATYLIDKEGYIRVEQDGIADWDNGKVYDLMDEMIRVE